jgi:hypothetical protein
METGTKGFSKADFWREAPKAPYMKSAKSDFMKPVENTGKLC